MNVVCILTPPGISAIAVVGLRGPDVASRLLPFFISASGRLPTLPSPPWKGGDRGGVELASTTAALSTKEWAMMSYSS
jgi:hypothetical protein